MQYIELSPIAAFLLRVNIITAPACLVNIITAPVPAGSVMIFTMPAGAVMIFTRSRNAATGDNSMYCMIPDPFPGRCKSWTLDSGLDRGLDRGLDGGLDFGLDFGPKFGPSFGLVNYRLFRLARRCQSMVLCLRASWKKRPQLL